MRRNIMEAWRTPSALPEILAMASERTATRFIDRDTPFQRVDFIYRHENPKFACADPRLVTNRFLPFDPIDERRDDSLPSVPQLVRCRKCAGCLRQKRAMWTVRAVSEATKCADAGRRSWCLTATHAMRPSDGGDEVFEAAITRALKRLRLRGRFRYLLVFERHKTRAGERIGYPHCHALIHEIDRIVYDDFGAVFRHIGFFRAKLLTGDPARAAGYVAKYMTKGGTPTVCRVRASFKYGSEPGEDPPRTIRSCESSFAQGEATGPVVTNPPAAGGNGLDGHSHRTEHHSVGGLPLER